MSSPLCSPWCAGVGERYLVRYDDDGEFEWIALAGPGMQEIVQFHAGRANMPALQKLEDDIYSAHDARFRARLILALRWAVETCGRLGA